MMKKIAAVLLLAIFAAVVLPSPALAQILQHHKP